VATTVSISKIQRFTLRFGRPGGALKSRPRRRRSARKPRRYTQRRYVPPRPTGHRAIVRTTGYGSAENIRDAARVRCACAWRIAAVPVYAVRRVIYRLFARLPLSPRIPKNRSTTISHTHTRHALSLTVRFFRTSFSNNILFYSLTKHV